MIASGSFDETVRLWDAKQGRALKVLPAHSEAVSAVNFCSDGNLLVSASYDGLVRLWDSTTGQCLKTLIDQANADPAPVSFARFSPNSKYILAATLDSKLRLWDFGRGKAVKVYQEHVNERFAIYAGFAGRKFVFAGSEDHTLVVWNLQNKRVEHRLTGHTDVVVAADSHPTKFAFASGGLDEDCTVRVWLPDEAAEKSDT